MITRMRMIIVAKEQTFAARGEPEGKPNDCVSIGRKFCIDIERYLGVSIKGNTLLVQHGQVQRDRTIHIYPDSVI